MVPQVGPPDEWGPYQLAEQPAKFKTPHNFLNKHVNKSFFAEKLVEKTKKKKKTTFVGSNFFAIAATLTELLRPPVEAQ